MPIYEFACKKCDTRFELMRAVSEMNKRAKCPSCKSQATKRLVTNFAFSKGSAPDFMESDFGPGDAGAPGGDFGGGDFGGGDFGDFGDFGSSDFSGSADDLDFDDF